MKKTLIALLIASFAASSFACNSIGWMLVGQQTISIGETLCTYEKSGVRLSIIVRGFCPISPC